MSHFWSDLVHNLEPYVPGEQSQQALLIKLNTNENPYPPAPGVAPAIAAAAERLRLYPEPSSVKLRQALAEYHHCKAEHVFIGNGSDEVLAHAFIALLKHDKPLLFPDISYSFYPVYCGLFGISYQSIALDEQFRINLQDYQRPAGGIIFPNPNAPTGIGLARAAICALLKAQPNTVVVVDEAYVDFGGESMADEIKHYNNLLVTRTFSKSRSLAGGRIGYALGNTPLIEALTRVKDSFNSYPMDCLNEEAAIASVADDAYFRSTCQRIIASRGELDRQLTELGFEVLPSSANFIFCRHQSVAAAKLYRRLREKNIMVRYFNKPRVDNFLRITVGNEEQCAMLIIALRAICQS